MKRKVQKKDVTRRDMLGAFTAAIGAALIGCGSTPTSPSASSGSSTSTGGTTSGACAVTPSETEGPYPDRTGMITGTTYYRQDVTEGKPGLPLALALTVVNVNNSCSPIANATVEIWHCDAAGNYSEYGNSAGQTFLRGLQRSDAEGKVTFNTIYPGWYQGRATHIHLEVFVNGASVKTTQMAFPDDVTAAVYATGVYASRGNNPTRTSSDGIFADGTTNEMATMTGTASSGYMATLQLHVAA
jgi:protocatechuate 3,4-dioxygenase beta subunit